MSGGHDYIQLLDEIVNPSNGSVSLRIRLPTAPGRGLTLAQGYNYDSANTYLVQQFGNTESLVAQSNLTSPWTTIEPSISWVHSSTTTYDEYGNVTFHGCGVNSSFVFQDLNGEKHSLGGMYGNEGASNGSYSPCGADQGNLSGGDGSVQSVMSSADFVLVADAHGTIYSFGLYADGNDGFQSTTPMAIEDSNGNLISYVGGGSPVINGIATHLTMIGDTLGRTLVNTIPVTINQSTTTSTPPRLWTVNTKNLVANPDQYHGCSSTLTGTMGGGSQQFQSIGLPNGTSYKFEYDPIYGFLSKITYPNGAFVRYEWGIFPLSDAAYFNWSLNESGPGGPNDTPVVSQGGTCSEAYDWPVVQHRYVSFDGINIAQQQDFAYSNTAGPYRETTVTTNDLVTATQSITIYSSAPVDNTPQFFFSVPPYIDHIITSKDNMGNILKTVTKQWYDNTHLSALIVRLDDGSTSETDYSYYCPEQQQACPTNVQLSGQEQPILPLETDYYDFGQNQHGGLLKKTITSYAALPPSPYFQIPTSFHDVNPYQIPLILDRPSQTTIYDNTGPLATTVYCYDQWPVAPLSGIVQHDDSVFTAAYNIRGNLTQMLEWSVPNGTSSTPISPQNCGQGTSAPVLSTTYSYDQTGQLIDRVDPKGNTTTFSYSDAFRGGPAPQQTNAYLTNTSSSGLTHQYTWDYTSGLLATSSDQNDINASRVGTTYLYNDPLLRASEINTADGGKTTYSYIDLGQTPSVSSNVLQDLSGTTQISTLKMDGMGRVIEMQLNSDPSGPSYTDTTYTGNGQVYTVSNPYRAGATQPADTLINQYDGLGRKTSVTHSSDGSSQTWSYSGNVVIASDEVGVTRQLTSDSLGRLNNVIEVLGGSNLLTTTYQYDALNNLRGVSQGGIEGEVTKTRSFTYDSLSHLVTASNPESGTICYGLWLAATCSGGYDANGNLVTKTDARGLITNYQYDALNRMVSSTIPIVDTSGAVQNQFQFTCYQYDTMNGAPTSANLSGHLVAEWTQRGDSGSKCDRSYTPSDAITAKVTLTYDLRGRPLLSQQCVMTMCTTNPFVQNQKYDLVGDLTSWTDGRGYMTFTQGFDAAGRPASLTNNVSGTGLPSVLFSAQGYTASGALQNWNIGEFLNATRKYDLRLRIQSESVIH